MYILCNLEKLSKELGLSITCELKRQSRSDKVINSLSIEFHNIDPRNKSRTHSVLVAIQDPIHTTDKFAFLVAEPSLSLPPEAHTALKEGDLKEFVYI